MGYRRDIGDGAPGAGPSSAEELRKRRLALAPPDSLQGELLRAVEDLREEACRGGNRNFGARHLMQCALLTHTLWSWPDFSPPARRRYGALVERIEQAGRSAMERAALSAQDRARCQKAAACTDEAVYDRLLERFAAFAMDHPKKIPFDGYPAAEPPQPKEIPPGAWMDVWVKELFAEHCKPLGYRREGANFRLIQPDGLGKVINFQRSRYNTKETCLFVVNTGLYFERGPAPENRRFKIRQCAVRARPHRQGSGGPWWRLEAGMDRDAVRRALDDFFSGAVLPWLARFSQKEALAGQIISSFGAESWGWIADDPLHAARQMAACGYGGEILPGLKRELACGRMEREPLMGLIAQIEAEPAQTGNSM